MEDKLDELASLAHKGKFSLYCQPDECLVRTYYKDGSQHKEVGKTLQEAVQKMIHFLKDQKGQ